ncbi:MFS and transmembrane domain-containing protein [Spironucleus salmonicida]|uniref:MFS and transmembrane domain-containing protein n=2 Tax=Spironucleus TaxID=39709 RepID=V6LEA7_9EUKA|nr:MFS and transmembrane domain-containing protein [Spironucleus salmonicida]|eukprot:EST42840.1 MFS and transmembrane domain-containing protein [Spironucleus salmonicida]
MTDLALNQLGLQYARNQYRLAQYVKLFAKERDFDIKIEDDHYLGGLLFTSPFLQNLAFLVSDPVVESEQITLFDLFQFTPTEQQKANFTKYVSQIQRFSITVDASLQPLDFSSYFNFIGSLLNHITQLQKVENMTKMEFNSDEFIYEFQASDAEIKLLINMQGTEILEVQDINQNLQTQPRFYQNNLWALYITLIIASIAFQLSAVNLTYFIQSFGATATDIANLTTYFNLVQMFSSFFWLFVSDYIGRKIVFLIILSIYSILVGVLLLAENFTDNTIIINFVLTIRAISGISAILVPLSFLIASDLAPPKLRGVVIVLVNCFSQVGSVISSGLTVFFSNYKKYNTSAGNITQDEILRRVKLSFRDTHITCVVLYIISVVFCALFLKESNQKLKTYRKLKKMNVKVPKNTSLRNQNFLKILLSMLKNTNMLILFFSYVLSLLGSTNSRTGGPYFTGRMYGFTNANVAKGYANTVQIVSILLGLVVSAVIARPFISFFGELRAIILAQYFSIFESIVYFAPNPPQPPALMYFTMFLTGVSLIFCDAIFLQLVSMYTTPQNRGCVMGVFQVGNSIGRSLSGVITGQMQVYNLRDSQLLNTIFQSGCLIILAWLKPPIQRPEMDQEASKRKLELKKQAMI